MAAWTPVSHSPICPPTNTGARSGEPRPRPTIPPDQACRVSSVAGRSHHGPSSPKGVIVVTVRCGAAARIASGVSVGHSARRDPFDHTTASARSSSARTRARSSASSGSAVTLCFVDDRNVNSAPSPPGGDRGARGRPAAQRVALRRLHLDDLRAAVGEELGAVGAGDPAREIDDDVAARAAPSFGGCAALLAEPPLRREAAVEVLHRLGEALVDGVVGVRRRLAGVGLPVGRPCDSSMALMRLPMYSFWDCFMISKKVFWMKITSVGPVLGAGEGVLLHLGLELVTGHDAVHEPAARPSRRR